MCQNGLISWILILLRRFTVYKAFYPKIWLRPRPVKSDGDRRILSVFENTIIYCSCKAKVKKHCCDCWEILIECIFDLSVLMPDIFAHFGIIVKISAWHCSCVKNQFENTCISDTADSIYNVFFVLCLLIVLWQTRKVVWVMGSNTVIFLLFL